MQLQKCIELCTRRFRNEIVILKRHPNHSGPIFSKRRRGSATNKLVHRSLFGRQTPWSWVYFHEASYDENSKPTNKNTSTLSSAWTFAEQSFQDLNTHKKNRQFAILADNLQVGAILDTDLHSNKVSSQPQNGADAVRRRACSLRPLATPSISSRRSSMIVDLGLGCTSTYNTSLQLSFGCVDFEVWTLFFLFFPIY